MVKGRSSCCLNYFRYGGYTGDGVRLFLEVLSEWTTGNGHMEILTSS